MIAYIQGKIIENSEKSLIILTASGVGYFVHVTEKTASECPKETIVSLYVHSQYREDAINLYGFENANDVALFQKFLSVNGVGPKTALDIMAFSKEMLFQAFFNNDPQILTQIKGLGKKTAERIILELKNKIDFSAFSEENSNLSSPTNYQEEVLSALEGLGYEKYGIRKTLQKKPQEITDTEEIIRWFLKNV